MLEELFERNGYQRQVNDSNLERLAQHLQPKQLQKLNYWIDSRCRNKPLQYILGNQPFLGSKILLRPPVLIPRWETEEWTQDVIQMYKSKPPQRILELCSGSGCISIALAKAFPNATIDALDNSESCFKLSRLNARKSLSDSNRLTFHLVDIMTDQIQAFRSYDLIVSNPPYVTPQEYKNLDAVVKDWESRTALVTQDPRGLEFYHRIASCKSLFAKDSCLVFEIGNQQGKEVKEILLQNGFQCVTVKMDLAGQDRCVKGVLVSN
jgi:release factor glutamine methyltransferase